MRTRSHDARAALPRRILLRPGLARSSAARSATLRRALPCLAASAVALAAACATDPRPEAESPGGADVDRVVEAYETYARGDCAAVQAGFESDQVSQWQPSEARYAYVLLDAYCAELAGDLDRARRGYRKILREAPLSFAGDDASERLRVLRRNEMDDDAGRTFARARENALSGSTARPATRRDPVAYPPIAHRAGISGHAVVEFRIAEDGTTDALIVVDSVPPLIFDGAAIRAVRNWRYATDAKSAAIDRQAIRLVFRPRDGEPAAPRDAGETSPEDSGADASAP